MTPKNISEILDNHQIWLNNGLRVSVISKPAGKCANFKKTNLKNYDFSGRDLSYAQFQHANLTGANLTNTKLFDTNFENAILKDVKGIDIYELITIEDNKFKIEYYIKKDIKIVQAKKANLLKNKQFACIKINAAQYK